MTRKTKILTASLMAGVGLLAVAAVAGHHGHGAFARGMDHAGGHHGWRGHKARGHHSKRKGPRRMLKRLKRMDVDNNGEVTQAEFLQRRQDRFALLDADKSNTLSPEELVSPMNDRREWRAKRMIKRLDANKDGKVTKDEMLAVARARFSKRDLDGDGEINKNDMPPRKGWWKRHRGDDEHNEGDRESRADDRDDDRAEGRRGHHGRKHGWRRVRTLEQVEKRVTRRFEKRDVNKDGVIDLSELTTGNQERQDFAKRKRLHRLDADKDGTVSKDEFLKKARDRFSIWDLDDNGSINAEDLPPALAQRWQAK